MNRIPLVEGKEERKFRIKSTSKQAVEAESFGICID